MIGALWILLATVIMGIILYVHHRFFVKKEIGNITPQIKEPEQDECCGQHAICEKDSLLTAVSNGVEYYDDEELDAYRGIMPGAYSNEQIEQFRDILYTLSEDDIAGWYRSIKLREIQLPTIISDELLLLISEKRNS